MRIPEKGKPVRVEVCKNVTALFYSMGETDEDNNLKCCRNSSCADVHICAHPSNWQEVEIEPVVRVPAEGKKVLCWNGDERPKEPAVRYSAGQLNKNNGWLCIYEYRTPVGMTFGDALARHWEEI